MQARSIKQTNNTHKEKITTKVSNLGMYKANAP